MVWPTFALVPFQSPYAPSFFLIHPTTLWNKQFREMSCVAASQDLLGGRRERERERGRRGGEARREERELGRERVEREREAKRRVR